MVQICLLKSPGESTSQPNKGRRFRTALVYFVIFPSRMDASAKAHGNHTPARFSPSRTHCVDGVATVLSVAVREYHYSQQTGHCHRHAAGGVWFLGLPRSPSFFSVHGVPIHRLSVCWNVSILLYAVVKVRLTITTQINNKYCREQNMSPPMERWESNPP